MQSVSSRIWTRVAVSISYDDNDYTTGTSTDSSGTVAHFTYKQRFNSIHSALFFYCLLVLNLADFAHARLCLNVLHLFFFFFFFLNSVCGMPYPTREHVVYLTYKLLELHFPK